MVSGFLNLQIRCAAFGFPLFGLPIVVRQHLEICRISFRTCFTRRHWIAHLLHSAICLRVRYIMEIAVSQNAVVVSRISRDLRDATLGQQWSTCQLLAIPVLAHEDRTSHCTRKSVMCRRIHGLAATGLCATAKSQQNFRSCDQGI